MSEYLDPVTREEMYLDVIRRLAEGETVDVSNLIEPVSRVERYLYDIAKNFTPGGSSVEVEALTVMENGEYTAETGKAYSPVTVSVDPSLQVGFAASNGSYFPETGYDGFSTFVVAAPVPSGTLTVTGNGTYDVSAYANANVNVRPNAASLSGTLAAPFGSNPALAALAATVIRAFLNNGYRAVITIDASALGMGNVDLPVSYMKSTGSGVEMHCSALDASGTTLADAMGASYTVTQTNSGATVNAALMLSAGQLVDISQYAASLPTVITYYNDGT